MVRRCGTLFFSPVPCLTAPQRREAVDCGHTEQALPDCLTGKSSRLSSPTLSGRNIVAYIDETRGHRALLSRMTSLSLSEYSSNDLPPRPAARPPVRRCAYVKAKKKVHRRIVPYLYLLSRT